MPKTIIANWKSNLDINQALYWLEQLEEYYFDPKVKVFFKNYNLVIAPPYPIIPVLYELSRKLRVKLAVQNLSPYESGSYTGEVCARNLTGLGVSHAIIGHSERRRYFHETHEMVADKLQQAWQAEMFTVLCVDEPDIKPQLEEIKEKSENWKENKELLTIAYEPLSAIGTGESADIEDVKRVIAAIKESYSQVPVLYGGSVNAENIVDFLEISDGVLVGGASLKAVDFIAILKAVRKSN